MTKRRDHLDLLTPALRTYEDEFGLPRGLQFMTLPGGYVVFAFNGQVVKDDCGAPYAVAYPQESWGTIKHAFRARARAAAARAAHGGAGSPA